MIYTIIVICWVILETAFFCIVAILASLFDGSGRLVHYVARIWSRGILFVSRIKVTVKGISNIDPNKNYICMPNHLSNFDIPVLFTSLPVQFRWIIKKELYKIPLFGFTLKRAGYIRIDRSKRSSAITSLQEAANKIRDGASVLIFPEGTRSYDGNLRAFKKGGFVMAVESGVPILPIVIHGTFQIMPKKQMHIRPGTVTLEICPPVDVSGYTIDTKDDLLEEVRNIIQDRYEKDKDQRL